MQQNYTSTPMYACSNSLGATNVNDGSDLGMSLQICAVLMLVASLLEILARVSYILCTWFTSESPVTSSAHFVKSAYLDEVEAAMKPP